MPRAVDSPRLAIPIRPPLVEGVLLPLSALIVVFRLYRIPTIIVNFYATEVSNPHGAVVDTFICLRFWDLATLPNKSFVS